MSLNFQGKIKIKAPIDVRFHRADLIRAILWNAKRPVLSLKNVFLNGCYYAISIHGEKIHIHRLLPIQAEQRF